LRCRRIYGQHENADAWAGGQHLPGGRYPARARHLDVHEHNVGLQVLDQRERLFAGRGFTDHLDIGLRGEQPT
jgi:hypothetical protein